MGIDDAGFLGRGWSFPPAFDPNTGVCMSTGERDIRESLQILLSTAVGERLLEPGYGCDLHRYVYEPLSASLQAEIEELVRSAILYYEPRIVLERVVVTAVAIEGRLDLHLNYRIPATNTRHNLVFPYYLREAVTRP
jgi:phage baseplate assembly protein W